jgi:hypothetical protein
MREPESPKTSPAGIASLLGAVAVIGAIAVFVLAKAGHRADDLRIADYDTATRAPLQVAREAHAGLEARDPIDLEKLDDAYGIVVTLIVPDILEPLHEREVAWFEALLAASRTFASEGDGQRFREELEQVAATRAEAERERDEVHCNADPSTCG